jgi:hypothetical protein
MLTAQEQKTDIQHFHDLQVKRKAICIELHKRGISEKENHHLTGMGIYRSTIGSVFPELKLSSLRLPELFSLAVKIKRENDAIVFRLKTQKTKPNRGHCWDCGVLLKLTPWHRSAKKSFCLSCWEKKLI